MEPKRVFILFDSPLFARGLGALLASDPRVELVGMGKGRPEQQAVWEEIQRLAPDAIILEQEDPVLLARAPDIAPGARLVTLSLSHNRIRTYQCHDLPEGGLGGIVSAITGSRNKGRPTARVGKATRNSREGGVAGEGTINPGE